MSEITVGKLQIIVPGIKLARAQEVVTALNPVLDVLVTPKQTFQVGINTPLRQAHARRRLARPRRRVRSRARTCQSRAGPA